jgi:hypothetical protein
MLQSHVLEANSRPANESADCLWKRSVHSLSHNVSPLITIINWVNPICRGLSSSKEFVNLKLYEIS